MEHFEKLVLDSAQHKPSLWLQYVEDTLVVWSQDPDQLQNFLSHLRSFMAFHPVHYRNRVRRAIPFLDVLVVRKGMTLATKVYSNHTENG
jgi:hypothetical protein